MNASQRLLRSFLKRDSYLSDFTADELQALLPILDAANDQIIGKIASSSTERGAAWLAAMKSDIDAIYAEAVEKIDGQLMLDLNKLSTEEGAWIEDELAKVAAGVSFSSPAPALLWATVVALPAAEGSTLAQLCEALGVGASKEVVAAIQLGMIEGETNEQLVQRLRGKTVSPAHYINTETGKKLVGVSKAKLRAMVESGSAQYVPGVYEGGAMETTTAGARALARTATMHVSNQARELLYAQNDDLIKGYQRIETLDLVTCIECGVEDGRFYAKDEPRPQLPWHINCRGAYVPVLKSFRELGIDMDQLPPSTRASMDGQVAEYTTWKDRLVAMSPEQRKAVLGPGRSALYDRGVSVDAMVSGGKLVPLKDLTKKGKGKAA